MHSQVQLEHQESDTLSVLGAIIDPRTVSDAVDLYLWKHKRETGQLVDRDAIGANAAAEAIKTTTSWLLAPAEPIMPPQTIPAGASPAQP